MCSLQVRYVRYSRTYLPRSYTELKPVKVSTSPLNLEQVQLQKTARNSFILPVCGFGPTY